MNGRGGLNAPQSARYYATAALAGAGWFVVFRFMPYMSELVSPGHLYSVGSLFAMITASVLTASFFHREITAAKTTCERVESAFWTPIAGAAVYGVAWCFFMALLHLPESGREWVLLLFMSMVVVVAAVVASILLFPLTIPLGFVSIWALGRSADPRWSWTEFRYTPDPQEGPRHA